MTDNLYQKFLNSPFRKPAGVALIIIGILALITPFTPGSWLTFLGFQLLGWNFLFGKKYIFFNKKKNKKISTDAER